MDLLISESLLGVLVGGAVALVAGVLTVRMQLRHDARQRERERLMQLRRDVFLEAAEGAAGTQQVFFRFADLNIPFADLAHFTHGKPGWLNKLHTVASPDAIRAFTRAEAALAKATFDLLSRRNELQAVEDRIKIRRDAIEHMMAFKEELRQSLRTILDQWPHDARSVAEAERLERNIDMSQATIASDTQSLESFVSQSWGIRRALLRAAAVHYGDYQQHVAAALLAMRRELDLHVDEATYLTLAEQNADDIRTRFTRLLDDVDEKQEGTVPAA